MISNRPKNPLVRKVLTLAVLVAALLAPVESRALDPARTLNQLRHTAWTIRDGIPASIFALAQTPDGYLWLGSISGLYRFDGVHAEAVPSQDAVYGLAVTDTGDLWIGSHGVSRLSHGVVTRVVVPSLSRAEIRIMAAGRGGQVWVANTDGQVAGFDGRTWRVIPTDWGGSGASFQQPGGVWGLAVARDGVVWAKNVLALYYLRPGATRFVKANGYGGSIVNFARGPDGRLWTADATTKRFYALPDLGSGPPPPPGPGAPVPPGVLGWIQLDHDGALWCANAVTLGLHHMRSIASAGGGAEAFTTANGLSGDIPDALLEDREGDIWVGTDSGLDRFAPANVVTQPGMPMRGQRRDITASDRAVYVATGRGVALPNSPQEQVFQIVPGSEPRALRYGFGNIDTFGVTPTGGLLVGSGASLRLVDGKGVTTVALPAQAHGDSLHSAADNGEELGVSLDRQGVFRRRGGVWSRVAAPDAPDGAPPGIRADRDGAFWLIYDDGSIRRLTGGGIDTYGSSSGPDIGRVIAFTSGASGVLLGGQFGVSRFDGHAFHKLDSTRLPFLSWTLGIVSDGVGGTWFSTIRGIVRVSTSDLDQALADPRRALDYRLFDARDGMVAGPATDQFGGNAVRAPDGRLGFLSNGGLLWIDPQHLYRNAIPPPVLVRSLTSGGRVLDAANGLKLPPGTANLQIDYTALSLQNPERVRFRYRLEGIDKTWIDAGGRRQAFYTRLGPGHYRFRVIAANNDGVWNNSGATLDFVIPPTFIQSGWFLLLCAIAAALALWALYTLRVRQVAASIQSRLEERVAERERIARDLHDTLLQGVQGLILRFQAIMDGLPVGQPARTQLDAVLRRADEVLAAGRDQVSHLRTASGADDLVESLIRAADVTPHAPGTEIGITAEGAARDLHPIVTEEVSAIGQEAIINALKHAHAKRIDVVISYDRHGLALRIRDDGVGIVSSILDAGEKDGHFGLIGMRERAKKIGGQLTISSRPEAGADVVLRVPSRAAFATPLFEPSALRWLRGRMPSFRRRENPRT